ncbi:MAG TPA: chemotaxis protein CheW [Vicinamibacterales bacterium]|nr:chemotaxis protein CheW [Vicinamibacterales bacterium]
MTTAIADTPQRAAADSRLASLAGKYLTFALASQEYGLAVRRVREIITVPPITGVPQVAPWIKGVINLRGKVIPVIDLRVRFNLPSGESTGRTCIIVVDVPLRDHTIAMGILVDSVSDVMAIGVEELENPPEIGNWTVSAYVEGLAKVKGGVKILLNLDHISTIDGGLGL